MLLPSKIKVMPHHTKYDIDRINKLAAKDFILEWFQKRIPSRRGGTPVKKPTSADDRIMILRSGTGSGKSTTLGPELYLRFAPITKKNIAVTQPRVLTATGIPIDIADIYKTQGIKLGENLGYQTGEYSYKPKKGIVFMTIGVLAQQLKVMSDEDFMNKYAFVIIDECHDRSLDMDLTLSLIKQLIHRNFKNTECPFLILTSATFDVKKYADYFMVSHKNILDVEGLNFPIQANFPKAPITDYVRHAASQALEIHRKNTDDYKDNRFTDILIFVYGNTPLKAIREILDGENTQEGNHFITIGLTSQSFHSGNIDYLNVFKPLSSINVSLKDGTIATPRRRIIIATNVAETGVTIDTLKYLIDTGYSNDAIFNPVHDSFAVLPRASTKASTLQRKGRVGRRAPGAWYPMFTKKIFDAMQEDKYPDLLTSDITGTILGLIIKSVHPGWDGVITEDIVSSGAFDIKNIDLLDYPAADGLMYSINKLYVLGMIKPSMEPTIIGMIHARMMKMAVENTRMIVAGYQWGANIIDLVTIAAFASIGKREYVDRTKNKYVWQGGLTCDSARATNNKLTPEDTALLIGDDFITSLFIWNDFMNQIAIMKSKASITHIKKWCEGNGLVYDGLLAAVAQRDAIIASMIQSIGLDPFASPNTLPFASTEYIGILKRCIYDGYRLNTATWDEERSGFILDTTHNKIKISSDAIKPLGDTTQQTKPKKIICGNISFRENRFNKVYQFECDTVSVLDSYVDTDDTFATS
jgi:HrpA-like RNA helicase